MQLLFSCIFMLMALLMAPSNPSVQDHPLPDALRLPGMLTLAYSSPLGSVTVSIQQPVFHKAGGTFCLQAGQKWWPKGSPERFYLWPWRLSTWCSQHAWCAFYQQLTQHGTGSKLFLDWSNCSSLFVLVTVSSCISCILLIRSTFFFFFFGSCEMLISGNSQN